MIATRRGLAVLAAIAALLGVLVVRELRRPRAAPEVRAILAGLDPEAVTALAWERAPEPAVSVTRGADGRWTWTSEGQRAAADTGAVRDVLAALRAGRWHRSAEVATAGQVRAKLAVSAGGVAREIGLGQELAGTEQAWLVVGERALLVDRWVARALDPAPLALRVRRPLEDLSRVHAVTLARRDVHVTLEGAPWRVVAPQPLLVRADLAAALASALEGLELVRLSRGPAPDDDAITVEAGVALRLGPTCPDDPKLAWLGSDAGSGCIARDAYDAVAHALDQLADPRLATEPRILPAPPKRIVLADGAVLDLEKRPTITSASPSAPLRGPANPDLAIDDAPADPVRVAELVAVLTAPHDLATPPAGATEQHRLLPDAAHLELLGDGLVRRAGEPLALRVTPEAYALLLRGGAAYRDRAVWTEEPTTISKIAIDGITYARGAVIGEWTRTPAGPVDGARVEALATALATATRSDDAAAPAPAHRVTLTLAAPVGQPVEHVLAVGAPRAGGACTAQAGDATVGLMAPVCASIAALAR